MKDLFKTLNNDTPMSIGLTVLFVIGGIHLMTRIERNQVLIQQTQKTLLRNRKDLDSIQSNQALIKKNTVDIERLQKIRLDIDTRIFDQLNDIKKEMNEMTGYLRGLESRKKRDSK